MTRPHTQIDRQTAHQINPLISFHDAKTTLVNLSVVSKEFGAIIADIVTEPDTLPLPLERMWMVMNVIAAALDYESECLVSTQGNRLS